MFSPISLEKLCILSCPKLHPGFLLSCICMKWPWEEIQVHFLFFCCYQMFEYTGFSVNSRKQGFSGSGSCQCGTKDHVKSCVVWQGWNNCCLSYMLMLCKRAGQFRTNEKSYAWNTCRTEVGVKGSFGKLQLLQCLCPVVVPSLHEMTQAKTRSQSINVSKVEGCTGNIYSLGSDYLPATQRQWIHVCQPQRRNCRALQDSLS